MNSINIERSLRFTFDDESWIVKILIGGVVSFLGQLLLIPLPLLYGYMLDTLKNVKEGQDTPLPEWDDFAGLFMRGLILTLGLLVYSLPLFLFACCFLFLLITSQNEGAESLGLLGLCFACIMPLYGVALGFWGPAVIMRFAEAGTFSSMFEFGRIWKTISADFGKYLLVVILIIVVNLLATFVGLLSVGVLVPFTSFWAMLVAAHLMGQYMRLISTPPSAEIVADGDVL